MLTCDICQQPIADEDSAHNGNEDGCPNRGADEATHECECDLHYHAECCPECNSQAAYFARLINKRQTATDRLLYVNSLEALPRPNNHSPTSPPMLTLRALTRRWEWKNASDW